MPKRFFTADFHLGMSEVIKYENRPFETVEQMNDAFMRSCEVDACEDDTIIHVGDLYSFRRDRGQESMRLKPHEYLRRIKATFVNVRGNHDVNNKVKSVCDSMRTFLGRRYRSVSVSHYPTYDRRCAGHFEEGQIHLCGHVHSGWRHCIDIDRKCLNVNVGVDVWGYRIVPEEELIIYLDRLFRTRPDNLYRCRMAGGRLVFAGDPFKMDPLSPINEKKEEKQ